MCRVYQSDSLAPDLGSGVRDAWTDRDSSVGSCRKIQFPETAEMAVLLTMSLAFCVLSISCLIKSSEVTQISPLDICAIGFPELFLAVWS